MTCNILSVVYTFQCKVVCELVCKIVAGWQNWQNSGRSCHSADVEPSPLPVVRAAKSTMSQIPSHVILSWFQEGWCRKKNIWGSFVFDTMHVFKILIVISTRTREDSGAGQHMWATARSDGALFLGGGPSFGMQLMWGDDRYQKCSQMQVTWNKIRYNRQLS